MSSEKEKSSPKSTNACPEPTASTFPPTSSLNSTPINHTLSSNRFNDMLNQSEIILQQITSLHNSMEIISKQHQKEVQRKIEAEQSESNSDKGLGQEELKVAATEGGETKCNLKDEMENLLETAVEDGAHSNKVDNIECEMREDNAAKDNNKNVFESNAP